MTVASNGLWKRMARSVGWACIVFAAAVVAVAVGLFAWRSISIEHTRASRRIDPARGVDSMEAIELGGIKQWVQIRGRDRRNPILLFLHGGPAEPMMPFAYTFQSTLEGAFTVVQWDQRGAGKTYFANSPDIVTPTVTYDRISADAVELINYLRQRFNQPKVFVLGHSWGSMLGLPLVHDHPELIYAYIGTGQVINVHENERVGYQHVLEEATRRGDEKARRQLLAIAPYPDPVTGTLNDKMDVVRHWQFRYGFAIYGKTSLLGEMLKYAFLSPDYSLHDTSYFLNEPKYTEIKKWVDHFDARKLQGPFAVPIIFIFGRSDWQVPGILAEAYLREISAPVKEFHYIDKASHSPMVEQPQAYADVVLSRVRPLAPPLDSGP